MFKMLAALVVVVTLTPVSAAAPSLSLYRDVSLGDTVATVRERLQLVSSDIKLLYEAPAMVHEVTWRPHRFMSGAVVPADPLAEMVLTFHADRLARIVAIYDRERTQGLTDADLLELLSATYGGPMLRARNTQPVQPATSRRHLIASWADADAQLLLWREDYPRIVGLTITATADDRNLQETLAEGARIAALGAPERERATQAAVAAAIKERDERIRLENKARFKP